MNKERRGANEIPRGTWWPDCSRPDCYDLGHCDHPATEYPEQGDTEQSTDLNISGLPPAHRVLRRHRWLSSIPVEGDGDPELAAVRDAAAPPRALRRGGRAITQPPPRPGAA